MLPHMSAKKEGFAFSHLPSRYKRVTVLERQAFFLVWGDFAQAFPPTLVGAQLVGTDSREGEGGA
jgi:hypothetical protein